MGGSINDVLSIATSGLRTAQSLVSVTSDNIANVNTPGYARKVASQSEIVANGAGAGVQIDGIVRAANQFLQTASLQANSQSRQASVNSSYLDQAQALFGDPSNSNSFFSQLDSVYSAFASAANTPSSNLTRSDAVNSVNAFLASASGLSGNLDQLQKQTNQQINADVTTINGILDQLSHINGDISRITVAGGDASGSQNSQSQLLNQLAGLMQIQVQPTPTGGVTVRSTDGSYLVGDQGASVLSYSTSGSSGILTATPPKGSAQQVRAGSGDIAGLMKMGQVDLPALSSQLSEFVSKAVDQINAAHNASSSVPAPSTLTGSNIGQSLGTAISGFSGKTTIAVVDASGTMVKRVDLNFGGATLTMAVDGGGASGATASSFLTSLNTALGSAATASFVNGQLTISATGGNGVAIADDSTTPSAGANGEGFSQFFGLNNLVESTVNTSYNTGLTGAAPNTFPAGGTIALQLSDATGAAIRQASFTIPTSGATTMSAIVNGLNQSIGAYGSFSLDSKGQMTFNPAANSGVSVSVVSDNTVNSQGGGNFTSLYGIGAAIRSTRAASYSIRTDIAANPAKLAMAQLDLNQTVGGGPALGSGDGRGAQAMAQSGDLATVFAVAGDMAAVRVSVSDYASELAGMIGTKAGNADNAKQSAAAVSTQADAQRASVEGVNMDEELVNLTTYQQSYSACSRLIQASSDMFNTLLQMI